MIVWQCNIVAVCLPYASDFILGRTTEEGLQTIVAVHEHVDEQLNREGKRNDSVHHEELKTQICPCLWQHLCWHHMEPTFTTPSESLEARHRDTDRHKQILGNN